MRLEYDDNLEAAIDKVNRDLVQKGLLFEYRSDRSYDGFAIYELTEVESSQPDIRSQRDELLEALRAVEARLTACANAFYVDGKAKALRAAFDGWKDDIGPARAAIAKSKPKE